jgi:DNA-binding response OmpR family regulator
MMPDMDGWEVVKEIKKRPNLKGTPIAMLTVKTMSPQYFYSSEVEELVDYINKPFSKKELLDRIKTIFKEVERVESIKKGLKGTAPDFMTEYEAISKTEKLYENLLGSLEFSLSGMDVKSHDYKLIKDAHDYGKVLLENIRERKETYEKLIKKE